MRAVLILSLITFCLLPAPLVLADSNRGIRVIEDLNHTNRSVGAYRALVIGINEYQDEDIPDLETAKNDALAIADLLKTRYGFEINSRDILLDRKATKGAIYNALRKLVTSVDPSDSVLIYYAGHGDIDNVYNDGWWIPTDAIAGDPVTYLDNVQIQKAMAKMPARHVLLISDSCYSGTLFGKSRAIPRKITDRYYLGMFNEKSRWGMTSGNKTPVSDRGSEGHSVFAYQLLKELRNNEKPYISAQEIYNNIAPIISNNSDQIPMCNTIEHTGDQGGRFIFIASPGAVVYSPVTTARRNQGHLYVRTKPQYATIRILNIRPRFTQGIELSPGRYHLEVAANGYITYKSWIDLIPGENKNLDIRLNSLEHASANTSSTAKINEQVWYWAYVVVVVGFLVGVVLFRKYFARRFGFIGFNRKNLIFWFVALLFFGPVLFWGYYHFLDGTISVVEKKVSYIEKKILSSVKNDRKDNVSKKENSYSKIDWADRDNDGLWDSTERYVKANYHGKLTVPAENLLRALQEAVLSGGSENEKAMEEAAISIRIAVDKFKEIQKKEKKVTFFASDVGKIKKYLLSTKEMRNAYSIFEDYTDSRGILDDIKPDILLILLTFRS